MDRLRRFSWRGPPLALQIVGLLLAVLFVAQLVTLLLTLLLPPAPKAQYGLNDIAAALTDDAGIDRLQRTVQSGPPDIAGPGWLVSERSRADLARLMGVPVTRVSLAFYTPLPFAGTTAVRNVANVAMVDDGPVFGVGHPKSGPKSGLVLAQFTLPAPSQGVMPPGARIEGPMMHAPTRDTLPPGAFPAGTFARERETGRGPFLFQGMIPQGAMRTAERPLISVEQHAMQQGTFIPGDNGAAVPELLRGQPGAIVSAIESGQRAATTAILAGKQPDIAAAEAAQRTYASDMQRLTIAPDAAFRANGFAAERIVSPAWLPRVGLPDRAILSGLPMTPLPKLTQLPPTLLAPPSAPVPASEPPRAAPEPTAPVFTPIPPAILPPVLVPGGAPQVAPSPPPEAFFPPAGPPIAIAPPTRGLFGLAPAPFVEGDFVAALRLPNGKWAVVQPAPEPFPNAWQRRVLLWFVISLALVAPFGWLFARRLVKPIDRFARAAEALGRDPSVAIGTLDGPAEIGRAALAFNLMQSRLRNFIDDRTAMIGAISHDLRTPLTRMRFRIEDVEGPVHDGLLAEVDAMEAMITEVIDFIRTASIPGARERLDLSTLVDDVVEDAKMVGSDVRIELAEPAMVEVDVLGLRRLLDNLLENAVKYGNRARIRVRTEADSAIAEIFDEGPGLPEDEIERAFEPFYRGEAARASDKAGSGLGLAVCRSIARAHGGDVNLVHGKDGFSAQVRVPLAFA